MPIPFNAEDVVGQSLKDISDQIDSAGFTNISKRISADGCLTVDQVLSVTINGQSNYEKDQYVPTDAQVIITYSSTDRVYVTDLLKDWKKSNVTELSDMLKSNGFTQITVATIATDNKANENLVASVSLNGISFTGEECYIPKDAPIILSYYVYRISIGAADEMVGQDYNNVVASLQARGFTNVQTEEVTTGWQKANTVISVKVNDGKAFDSDETFKPDVKIVVKYSSADRIDITDNVQNYTQIKNYKTLISELKALGFTHVESNAVKTNTVDANQSVKGITIGSVVYESGDCAVPKDTKIVIEYYKLYIKVGISAETILDQYKDEGSYENLKSRLENLGFTNITLYRANDLLFGVMDKEGAVESITIAGMSNFTSSDDFAYNAEIKIVVHTKKSGCEDITLVDPAK